MSTRVALITGANKGIGLEVARRLGAVGVTVLAGARSAERGAAAVTALRAEGADAHVLRLDVTDEASVTAAAKLIEGEHGRLDILVNNAGIAYSGGWFTAAETPVSEMRGVYETNVFGVVAVTNAMLPLLRQAPAGRVVNVSSDLGSLTWASDPEHPYYGANLLAYNSAKTAVNAITVSYAKDLRDTPIKVNAANPGYCATDLNGHTGVRSAAEGAAEVVRLAQLPAEGPTGGFYGSGADGPIPW
ncbi:SDR family oxidoreductase [Actinomadura sp. HBU206391]|uniref:SDR family oxidoreductase n=1 Tax=Actinomadura sp. HBU206391 TaxID=2731692 RepID=UPI00164FDE2C|nr:SDR family oxidoreductase [Actinomadura sp. HBU206391]MBC6461693.1 SDR family oxidoreductase [Actinomadura sp. HBU206391]